MNHKIKTGIASIVILSLALTAASAQEVELDFSGWDPDLLSMDGGSQTFADICGDIDVTVTTVGEFDAPTMYSPSTNGSTIESQHNPSSMAEAHSFMFEFSSPFDLIVDIVNLDGMEELEVTGSGVETYAHVEGIPPVESSIPGGILLDGIGFGQGPTGSAQGRVLVDAPDSGPFTLTVLYRADANDLNITKYGGFRLLKPVPEPNSAGLLGIGMLAIIGRIKRRRR